MNYLDRSKIMKWVVRRSDNLVSLLILGVIAGVIVFGFGQTIDMFHNIISFDSKEILRAVALIIILVKAYRLLVFYMESHHVSVKYIVEISIIAPAVELIFAPELRSFELNALYAVFALLNLFLYVRYYGRLCDIDDTCAVGHDQGEVNSS